MDRRRMRDRDGGGGGSGASGSGAYDRHDDEKRRRSRSYSPVASRLRYRSRRHHPHARPPTMPPLHRSYLRSRSGSRSRSARRPRTNGGRMRSSSLRYSRSRSRTRSRSRKRSDTRSRTGSHATYRRSRPRKNGHARNDGFRRGDSYSTRQGSGGNGRGSRARRSRDRSERPRRGKKPREDSWRSSRHRETREQEHRSAEDRDASDDSAGHDDTVGSYEGKPGDYIANRYKIIREAGLGTFGRVLECLDKVRDIVVAIKVVRKVEKYSESAKIEANILQDVNEKDERNESLCVQMYKWFEYKGHVCLVFERLGCSLYDYLKSHDYKPFPMRCIRAYAWQLLTSLEFIHRIKLIHTDLKPENILLVDDEEERGAASSPSSTSSCSSPNGNASQWSTQRNWKQRDAGVCDVENGRHVLRPPVSNAVKLIDFGGATYDDESKSSIINTRQYRSPEVILGLGWSYPSDIWSAGCIIAEMYLGELLFATHENMEHLALIEKCIGRLPDHIAAQAAKQHGKMFRRGRLNWPDNASSQESVDHVRKMHRLEDILNPVDAETGLLDLLQLMLVLDPENRVTAKEALNHPFFDGFSRRDITPAVPSGANGRS